MLTFTVRAKLWLYNAPGGWHFITLPPKPAREIKGALTGIRRGWGSLAVEATIGKTVWKTSIFPDRKSASYLLPVKSDVRKKENIHDGDTVVLTLKVMI